MNRWPQLVFDDAESNENISGNKNDLKLYQVYQIDETFEREKFHFLK